MATVSERVHVMKENFMELHNKGYSIPEIAEMSNISFSCLYSHLQEIADENGVTRESLLKIVRTEKSAKKWETEAKKVKVDVESMLTDFKAAAKFLAILTEKIDNIIEEEKEYEESNN